MSKAQERKLHGLATVVDLRAREKDRLLADLATKQALAERYRTNLVRLEALCESAGVSALSSGAHLSAMSQNRGDYKQAVMLMAEGHRSELQLHEADMRVAQQALTLAVHRHEALAQVFVRQTESLQASQSAQEQKRQDEIATQSWLRGMP